MSMGHFRGARKAQVRLTGVQLGSNAIAREAVGWTQAEPAVLQAARTVSSAQHDDSTRKAA